MLKKAIHRIKSAGLNNVFLLSVHKLKKKDLNLLNVMAKTKIILSTLENNSVFSLFFI